jgi:hypothetical protein
MVLNVGDFVKHTPGVKSRSIGRVVGHKRADKSYALILWEGENVPWEWHESELVKTVAGWFDRESGDGGWDDDATEADITPQVAPQTLGDD